MTLFPPHPFSLRQLQYALAVAEEKSFRRAAERCAVSQPALSAQLAGLERALGVVLFERARQPVLVTPAGDQLLPRIRRLVLEAEDLAGAARLVSDPLAGTLRLGVIPTISPYFLPEAAPALRKGYPLLSIHWVEEKTAVLARRLHEGSLDGAILAMGANLGEVETVPLASDPFVLAASTSHPLGRSPGPVPTRDLRGHDVLLLDDGHCFREQALSVCTQARAREESFRATSLPTLVQMTAGGSGVTLLPLLAVRVETRQAALTIRPFAAPAPFRNVVLAFRRGAAARETLVQIAGSLRLAWPKPG
jgi:LysR family hydrogen peroxide-inducible transcriptional activator